MSRLYQAAAETTRCHLENGISWEVIWFDFDQKVIEIVFACSNGRFSGTCEVYLSRDELSELADTLKGFPLSGNDTRSVELGTFDPKYADGGVKMNFYCSVVDDQLRREHDTPTLGLILCQTKDRILAEYALRDIHKPIGIADYELTRALPRELASSRPSIESIEAELSRNLATEETEGPPASSEEGKG